MKLEWLDTSPQLHHKLQRNSASHHTTSHLLDCIAYFDCNISFRKNFPQSLTTPRTLGESRGIKSLKTFQKPSRSTTGCYEDCCTFIYQARILRIRVVLFSHVFTCILYYIGIDFAHRSEISHLNIKFYQIQGITPMCDGDICSYLLSFSLKIREWKISITTRNSIGWIFLFIHLIG